MRPSAVVSAYLPNTLTIKWLENLHVTHQSQVISRGLSYVAVFFSSTIFPGEISHCPKRFVVIQEEGIYEGLFDKEPVTTPLEIHNSTAPPSAPGEPIEAGVFNASNWVEEMYFICDKGMKVDDDMEPAPKNVPLLDTPNNEACLRDGHGDGMSSIAVLW